MSAIAAGAIMQGAGAILGGLGVGRSKTPSPEYQSAVSLNHERASFAQKMALAKEHGLHPLSVLGVPGTSFSPVYQSGGGFDAGAIGAGLGSLFDSPDAAKHKGVEPEQHPAPVTDALEGRKTQMMDIQLRRAEAEASMAELQLYQAMEALKGQPGRAPGQVISNDVIRMQKKAADQAGIPLSYFSGGGPNGKGGGPIDIKQEILPPHPTLKGFAAGVDQAWLRGQDQNGQVNVLNPQLVQADYEKGATLTALAQIVGLERAIQITALLENEALLAAAGVGGAMLMRHPVAKGGKWLLDKFARTGLPKLKKASQINPPKGGRLNSSFTPWRSGATGGW